MSLPVTFNGVSYLVAQRNDLNWGPYTTQFLYALGSKAAAKDVDNLFAGFQIIANTGGLVLQSPNGTYFQVAVDDNGVLSTTPVVIS